MLHEVESQLEVLNFTASQINDLENRLLESRTGYHTALSEQSDRLKALSNRLGRCVRVARPYYEARLKQIELLQRIQVASAKYNLANDTLTSSRDALARLEEAKCHHNGPLELDTLESINRALAKVNDAIKSVADSKAEHERLLHQYDVSERVVRQLERKHKTSINKAAPYFMHKQLFEQRMQESKLQIDVCAEKVRLCKVLYSEAMLELERISESLHFSGPPTTSKFVGQDDGDQSQLPSITRGQGVGAESPDTIEVPLPHATDQSSERFSFLDADPDRVSLFPSSPARPPARSPAPTPVLDGLVEHVQQAKVELASLHLVVNQPVDFSSSTIDQLAPFQTGFHQVTLSPSRSPMLIRPRTPGEEANPE